LAVLHYLVIFASVGPVRLLRTLVKMKGIFIKITVLTHIRPVEQETCESSVCLMEFGE